MGISIGRGPSPGKGPAGGRGRAAASGKAEFLTRSVAGDDMAIEALLAGRVLMLDTRARPRDTGGMIVEEGGIRTGALSGDTP